MEEKILIESTHYGLNKKSLKFICIAWIALTLLCTLIAYASDYSYYSNMYKYYEDEDGYSVRYQDEDEKCPECEHSYVEKYSWYYSSYSAPRDGYTYADFKADHPNVMSYVECVGGDVFNGVANVWTVAVPVIVGILLIFGLLTLFLRATKIKVTNLFVYGKLGRNKVILPVDSVTAIATGGFKSLALKTSGGAIRCLFIKNQQEIVDVIKDLLVAERCKDLPVLTAPLAEDAE